MRIINIVDRLDRVNFGIWNAAIATSGELQRQFGVESEVWFPESTNEADETELTGVLPRGLESLDQGSLERVSMEAGLDPSNDIIVSHGCWQFPTRWGMALKEKGFPWMAVPHGMLESWSLSQKRLRKWMYFHLLERRALQRAHVIRAVGRPEFTSLKRHFEKQLVWIANGVPGGVHRDSEKTATSPRTYLFMARLHHKKGLMPLVKAWESSELGSNTGNLLKIAGPDDGELPELKTFLEGHPGLQNVHYLGPVYGEEKAVLLKECHYYVLPSYSEGFPTSVLEAMQNGLVPLISIGCNFPDVFEEDLGIRMEPDQESIQSGLRESLGLGEDAWLQKSHACRRYIEENYTHEFLAQRQFETYQQMLKRAFP